MDEPMSDLCSVRSRELGEPLGGTAVARTSVWIVLEHRGPWGAKAVPESDLPPAVKERLAAWEHEIDGARVQLVRRSGDVERQRQPAATAAKEGPLRLWLGVSELGRARLLEHTLTTADDLLHLDLPGWVDTLRRGDPVPGTHTPAAPLVLVCTNGRRDVCCSKLGIPVIRTLESLTRPRASAEAAGTAEAELPGLEVWHTTHLGGHRFAATLLVLPEGLCYGRVEPDEAPELAAAVAQQRIYRLDRLRGRTALAEPEQAAEVIWRERTGRLQLDALAHIEHAVEGTQVRVTLRDREGATHEVRLERRELGVTAPPSCGKPPEAIRGWYPS